MRLKAFVFFAIFGLWFFGVLSFYRSTQHYPGTSRSVDAIVVLTGSKDRIQTGMALFKQLQAKRILISGVDKAVRLGDLKDKQLKGFDDIHEFTDLGYGAVNTFSNALEAAFWVRVHQFKVVALVTSRFHIPRSLWLFKKAMPEIEILPIVVDSDDSSFYHLLREYHKYYLTKMASSFLFDTDSNNAIL